MHALLNETMSVRPRRRGRRMVLLVGGLTALAALGVSAPALAQHAHRFLAQTGWFTSPNPPGTKLVDPDQTSTETDTSEWVSVTSPDFVAYSVSILPPEIVLPPAYSIDKFAVAVATAQKHSFTDGGLIQATGIRSHYEQVAQCVWMNEWLAADTAHDAGRAASAAVCCAALHGGPRRSRPMVGASSRAWNPWPRARPAVIGHPWLAKSPSIAATCRTGSSSDGPVRPGSIRGPLARHTGTRLPHRCRAPDARPARLFRAAGHATR